MADELQKTASRLGREIGPLVDAPDPVIQRIVDTWPVATDASRALNLGLPAGESLEEIIEGYIEDFLD